MQPAWVTTNAPADMARFAKRQLSAQPSRSLASVTQFTLLAMKLPDDCQVCSLSKPQEEWFRGSNTLMFDRPLLNDGVAGPSISTLGERIGILPEASRKRI